MMSEIVFGFKFGLGVIVAVWLAVKMIDFLEESWREMLYFWRRNGRR